MDASVKAEGESEIHQQQERKEGFTEIPIVKLLSEIKCLDYDLGKLKNFIEESELTHKIMYFSYNRETGGNTEEKTDNSKDKENKAVASSSHREKSAGSVPKLAPKTESKPNLENQGQKPASFTNIDKIFGFCLHLLKGYRYEATVALVLDRNNPQDTSFSYYPLDISPLFNEIVNKAHAVLFTGGTMKPKGLLEEVLKKSDKQVITRDFPAVIAPENIICSVVSGLQNRCDFLFNHANNYKLDANLKGISDIIQGIEVSVPGGIIVFFTSYKILGIFKEKCERTLILKTDRELVFDSEKAFDIYKDAMLKRNRRAILFSVMGGKLSEGINFKDTLGRRISDYSSMCHCGGPALP